MNSGILFRFGLFYECSNLEYVDIRVIYRVHQAESGIRILVAASHEYVNTDSTRRTHTHRLRVPGQGGRMLLNSIAIALEPCGSCRWGGG